MTFSPYKRTFLLALALAVVFARPAHADEFEVPWSKDAEVSYRVAQDYWNVVDPPNCGSVQKILGAGPPSNTQAEQGRAVATQATDFWERCVLITTDGIPFSQMCPAVVHAFGHLLGKEHDDNPAAAMYAGWPVRIDLCEIEAARLAGFGPIAAERIATARKRCVKLRRQKAVKRRVKACRRNEAGVRRRLAVYLQDPYLVEPISQGVTYQPAS